MNKKQEIKNRIDLINKGEVPEGYKKNKGYIIPDVWDIYPAGNIFKNLSIKNTDNSEQNVLSVTQDRGVIPREDVGIDIKYNEESLNSYKKVKEGNFIISLRSFQGGIEYSQYDGIVSPAYTILENILPINDYFYATYLKMDGFIKRLNTAVYGIRDGKQIGYDDFSIIPTIYPPKQEQEKIAEILSCCDKVIELKEKLIKEKNKQKEIILYNTIHILQNVRHLKLKEISECFIDGDWIEKKDQSDKGIRLIQTGNIGLGKFLDKNTKAKYISELKFEKLHCTEVLPNDILISRLPDPVGRACIIPRLNERIITAVDCSIMRLKTDYLPEYVILSLNTNDYFKQIKRLTNTSTRDRITRKELENITIPVVEYKEQKKVAEQFNCLNNELDLLEQELEQYKQLKKSLSQLLLTGIVRVNEV